MLEHSRLNQALTVNTRGQHAFTLVELLVVIAIVTILASLLLPAISQGKGKAKLAVCTGNEKQLSLVWRMYSEDNWDKLAPNAQGNGGQLWVNGAFRSSADCTNLNLTLSPQFAMFATYIRGIGVYKCPSSRPVTRTSDAAPQEVPLSRNYELNGWVGYTGDPTTFSTIGPCTIFKKGSDIVTPGPSSLFTFLDVHPDSICSPMIFVYMTAAGAETIGNYPAVYHDGRGVVAFADSHVEERRWVDPRTLAAASANFHAHKDSSPNNADVVWLEQHGSAPVQ